MAFAPEKYTAPDFNTSVFVNAPNVKTAVVLKDGVAPENFHSTSMFPEYFKVNGNWLLPEKSRMDSSVIIKGNALYVVENRNLKAGDLVILGRTENCEEGIFVHTKGFLQGDDLENESFVFRQGRSRETSYAKDYDRLTELLKYEKQHGKIVWVLGPAVSFDFNARRAMEALINNGYVNTLMAGNALATHDLEAATLNTALGQDIYSQKAVHNGHYNHLDICNSVRAAGSVHRFIKEKNVNNGIMWALDKNNVPFVLTGSIRDDGPLPDVIGDCYLSQAKMREATENATTVICMATMLHTIATGNMLPSYRVSKDGTVRPLYFYCVDASEFVVNKLLDRGSLSATTMVTNVQDFVTLIAKRLEIM